MQTIDGIGEPDVRLRTVHHDWQEAGERTQATVRLLSEQLRRFLDDRIWLENRRVVDLLLSIERTALALRDHAPVAFETEIDATAPSFVLPMERPLYRRTEKPTIDSSGIVGGEHDGDVAALFDQVFVDRERLAEGVRAALNRRVQVGLGQVLVEHPIEQGWPSWSGTCRCPTRRSRRCSTTSTATVWCGRTRVGDDRPRCPR